MPHSAEMRLRAMPHNADFFANNFIHDLALCNVKIMPKFSSQLCAMRHSAESTHIRKYLGEIETKF
jgi:hypothetical protein